MQIDANQPIMFDNEAMPGISRGYWQPNPFARINDDDGSTQFGSAESANASPRAVRAMQITIFSAAIGLFVVGGILASFS
jgi:hypothetical protein